MLIRLVVLALSLAACASTNRAYGTDPVLPSSVTITLPGAPQEVESRVFAALVRDHWSVSERQSGIITVGPYKPAYDPGVSLVMRATFVEAGADSSIVTVSGVVASDALMETMGRRLAGAGGATYGRDTPIRQATAGRGLKNWQEVGRMAATIRASVP
jgi:hypothetical protein